MQQENIGESSRVYFRRSDIISALVIGEAIAWLLYVMVKVNAPELPIPADVAEGLAAFSTALIMAFAFPLLSLAGMYAAYFVGKKIKSIYEAAKFALVGALNTFVDLGVLNLLILLTSITAGSTFSVFKGLSFIIAVLNSYVWNKFWTFKSKKKSPEEIRKEFIQFFFVSVIGFFVNVATASFVVNMIGPQFGMAAEPWANIGALAGTFTVFIWNFIGYKFWVFKR
ncbi:MAG: GtrA family protein [Candidatus Spechtbacterales bacterium]